MRVFILLRQMQRVDHFSVSHLCCQKDGDKALDLSRFESDDTCTLHLTLKVYMWLNRLINTRFNRAKHDQFHLNILIFLGNWVTNKSVIRFLWNTRSYFSCPCL